MPILPPSAKSRAQRVRHAQRAERIDLELAAHAVEAVRVERIERLPAEDAGIEYQRVDAHIAQALRQRLDRGAIGDIDARLHPRTRLLERRAAVPAHRDDVVAALGELLRQRQTDTAIGAGDQDVAHGVLLGWKISRWR